MNPNSYLMILGRQPALGLAELERRFGAGALTPLNESVALLRTDRPVDINLLGGTVKVARLAERTGGNGWLGVSKAAVKYLERELAAVSGKVTLGVSAYGFDAKTVSAREVQKTGLIVKTHLKNRNGSIRLIPSDTPALSSAQTFHNKLAAGGTKRELILVRGGDGRGYIGELTGVQDIDAYTLRDRGRPKRDALNGMLPPKLAQIMVNIVVGDVDPRLGNIVYDPFCGTGVVLQEASLIGFDIAGSDINPKMVDYTDKNLLWLLDQRVNNVTAFDDDKRYFYLEQADATTVDLKRADFIASETFLGEPMAQEPSAQKLVKVMSQCDEIIRQFLENVMSQKASGFSLCIAVPAWRINGEIKHLPVVDDLKDLGYNWIDFEHVRRSDLIYYREDQIVARELLVIRKA